MRTVSVNDTSFSGVKDRPDGEFDRGQAMPDITGLLICPYVTKAVLYLHLHPERLLQSEVRR